ncbi:hypothetical protein F4860DRAFT_367361 [Xylaria cubensis]|nr:hypothetical protein F4860DRAFT_367361 [Xylaria cubensis]
MVCPSPLITPLLFCSQTIVDYTLALGSMDIMNHKYDVEKPHDDLPVDFCPHRNCAARVSGITFSAIVYAQNQKQKKT